MMLRRAVPIVLTLAALAGCQPTIQLPTKEVASCDLEIRDERGVDPASVTIVPDQALLRTGPGPRCSFDRPLTEYVRQEMCAAGYNGKGAITGLEIGIASYSEKGRGRFELVMDDGTLLRAAIPPSPLKQKGGHARVAYCTELVTSLVGEAMTDPVIYQAAPS